MTVMLKLLWLVPAIPLAGSVLLMLNTRMRADLCSVIGTAAVGASAVIAAVLAMVFISSPPSGGAYTQVLWTWISEGWFSIHAALRLDPLSLVMVLVVAWVGFLIHVYSAEYMAREPGLRRFFACMNLFVASMLVLVLADNLLLLYLGWEGVGLCSYLLIGFWYADSGNVRAARKSFIVTRVGDTAFIIGIIYLALFFRTLNIQEIMNGAVEQAGGAFAVIASALILAGALGKSAQLPLQTWLPDAMAGPTPVSALIHAATMVAAGVYLIARTHALFELAPPVMATVAAIGAVTLLMACFSALAQTDIKRILAYSTISQIGYMFLALGLGAWSAALFHFFTHAFFKSLLFLGAGAVTYALGGERNILKMGGLRRDMPLAFWTFLAGAASLSALPFVTAGFYSKDLILDDAWSQGAQVLWAAGVLGAFLTALYSFRTVFLVFFGERGSEVTRAPGAAIYTPLVILAALSLAAGFVQTPAYVGGMTAFSDLLRPVFHEAHFGAAGSGWPSAIAFSAPVAGLLAAYLIYRRRPASARSIEALPLAGALKRFWASGWGFDWLYNLAFVRPFLWAAAKGRADFFDLPFAAAAFISARINKALSMTQTGKLRLYAAGITIGAAAALSAVLLR